LSYYEMIAGQSWKTKSAVCVVLSTGFCVVMYVHFTNTFGNFPGFPLTQAKFHYLVHFRCASDITLDEFYDRHNILLLQPFPLFQQGKCCFQTWIIFLKFPHVRPGSTMDMTIAKQKN
jgi:hypothetical protein